MILDSSAIVAIALREPGYATLLQKMGDKGRHPAALNFGDCLSYAAAALAGEPLLCVGDDFPRTDIALA